MLQQQQTFYEAQNKQTVSNASKEGDVTTIVQMAVDLDRWIEKIRKCESLTELELQTLCEFVSEHFCQTSVSMSALR